MDKYIKVINMMEHPEKYSDSELTALLEDEDIREIYNSLCLVENSFQPKASCSKERVEEEWKKIDSGEMVKENSERISRVWWRNIMVVAAVTVAIVALGAMAVELGLHSRSENSDTIGETGKLSETVMNGKIEKIASSTDELTQAVPDTILFENECLETILKRMATHYGIGLRVVNPEKMGIRLFFRWETASDKEYTIKRLNNFERINLILERDTLVIR